MNITTPNTWFTSDLHFRHKNVIGYSNRPFDNVEEMNAGIVDAWNSQVGKDDTVVHLGDFCFGGLEVTKDFIQQLNGQKIFVLGNHDSRKHWSKIASEGTHLGIVKVYFGDGASINIGEQRIVMSHFPYYIWDGMQHGAWNVHGHCHGNAPETPKKQFDVGIDNKFKLTGKFDLWSYEELAEIMANRVIQQLDHH